MNKKLLLLAVPIALVFGGCQSYTKPPMAVKHSTYTDIPDEEKILFPEEMKVQLWQQAAQLHVLDNGVSARFLGNQLETKHLLVLCRSNFSVHCHDAFQHLTFDFKVFFVASIATVFLHQGLQCHVFYHGLLGAIAKDLFVTFFQISVGHRFESFWQR